MTRNRPNTNLITSDFGEAQIKKHRPKDTRLLQQRLVAWQPILTAKTVFPLVFSISLLFIPIGVVLLYTSQSVQEYVVQYVDDANNECKGDRSNGQCVITFNLKEDFKGDVYFYYALENYFQNHRRYMKSRNDVQLLGVDLTNTKDCTPFEKAPDGRPIAPCGAIANSLFNDSFQLVYFGGNGDSVKVSWSYDGLVWPVDLESKFINPSCDGQPCKTITNLCHKFSETVRPPNWQKDLCHLDNTTVDNSGFQNIDFIIWMRTAALPDFRKPYRKLTRTQTFVDGLPSGRYQLWVENHYNVSGFGGKKSFVISTTSWMGGKNSFLGIAYIFVGVLCACLGFVFIFVHLKYGHTLEEIAGLEQLNSRHIQ